jgi:leader peptidase (prepilin peptidase)/N-methyltransferase
VVTALLAVAATTFGLLAGSAVDTRVRRAAAGEARTRSRTDGPPLDQHLAGGRRRRLLVPVLAGAACLSAALRWPNDTVLVPFLFFLPLLAGLAVVDLHTRRLPNVLTWPAFVGGLVLVVGSGVAEGEVSRTVTALTAAVLLFATLLVLNLLRPSGMGAGDVKVAGLIGLFVGLLGLGPALLAAVLAAVLAWLGGLGLIAGGRITRHTPVPFGPYLALGALVAVLAGPQLTQAYLSALS